jgi:putrescine importer
MTSPPTAASQATAPQAAALNRVLGVGGLVAFGLAYMVPLTVFTTFGSATRLTAGHLPTAYLVTTVAMLFTAASYALIVRAYPSAGSAYTYTARSFGPHLGFLTGWTLLLDYLLLPGVNYLIIGIYLNAQFPAVPTAVFITAAIAVATALNLLGINTIGRVSLAMVAAQLAFAVVFVALALAGAPPDPTALIRPFYSESLTLPAVFAGAAVLCLSFLGFDAVSTLSEEARDPRRTVPRAMLLTTVAGGMIFVLLSYASALVLPDWRAIQVSDAAGLEVMAPLGGPVLVAIFLAVYLGGCLASAVAAQASVARILFAMGRDGALPRGWFGVLDQRFQSPRNATLTVGAISLLVLAVSLDVLVSVVSFGALFAFTMVNLTVIKQFVVDEGRRAPRDLVVYGLVPLTGCALTVWLWFSLSGHALLTGGLWIGAGAAYLALRTRGFTRPVSVKLDMD